MRRWPRLCARMAPRVRPREELRGGLPEEEDLGLNGLSERGLELLEIDRAFVREVVEDVERLFCGGAALLAAEDEVDPLVQVCGDVLALERGAVLADEVLWRGGPRREAHVAERAPLLRDAERQLSRVAQEVGAREELGDELLDVGHVGEARVPRAAEAVKEAIGNIEETPLQPDVLRREGLEADEEVEDDARRRVVRAVVEGPHAVAGAVGERRVPLAEPCSAAGLEGAHRLGEVAEGALALAQVELLGRPVGEDPRHDRVLREIIVRAARERVQPHQVIKVRDSPALPVVDELLVPALEYVLAEARRVGLRGQPRRTE